MVVERETKRSSGMRQPTRDGQGLLYESHDTTYISRVLQHGSQRTRERFETPDIL